MKQKSEILQALDAEKRPNPQLREKLAGCAVLAFIALGIGSFWALENIEESASSAVVTATESTIAVSVSVSVSISIGSCILGNRYIKIGQRVQAAQGVFEHIFDEMMTNVDITAADPQGFTDGPSGIELRDWDEVFTSRWGNVAIESREQIS